MDLELSMAMMTSAVTPAGQPIGGFGSVEDTWQVLTCCKLRLKLKCLLPVWNIYLILYFYEYNSVTVL